MLNYNNILFVFIIFLLYLILKKKEKFTNRNYKICKHIIFFYNEDRIKYINKIIDEVNKYGYETDIFLHSNKIYKTDIFNTNNKGKIIVVEHDLSKIHPYKLTWKCRDLMKKQKNDYDIFIYIEDDILIYKEALDYWFKNKDSVIQKGYNLGFLRVEFIDENTKYLTDITQKFNYNVIKIDNQDYIINDINPYCAFWIYDKKEFNNFINSKYYNPNNIEGYGIREKSGIGLHGINSSYYKGTLIPITDNKKINKKCTIHHIPNNYLLNKSTNGNDTKIFSTIKLNEAITL